MVDHSFGGPWTARKLKCLGDYLNAYRTIFTGNRRARFFRTWYVDAFAGTGSRSTAATSDASLLDIYSDEETKEYQKGSAKIALGLSSPFDQYLFIEKSRRRASELRRVIKSDFLPLDNRCEICAGEANAEIRKWCAERDWSKERAVVFLDPYGMQVEWETVRTLAATRGVDLWYLFPGIARLLTRSGKINAAWNRRLDILFGTNEWQARFFETKRQQGLFGEVEHVQRTATEDAIQQFIHERLATCFGRNVAKGLILRNSKSSPLYFLCFAASNERGAKSALNIANSILDD
jgi:three-Cys-motif partner protein